MNDNAMINLVQRITHVHLKQADIRHQPKRVEEQVKSCLRMLLPIMTTSRSLCVPPAIIAEQPEVNSTTGLPAPDIPADTTFTVFFTLAVVSALNVISASR